MQYGIYHIKALVTGALITLNGDSVETAPSVTEAQNRCDELILGGLKPGDEIGSVYNDAPMIIERIDGGLVYVENWPFGYQPNEVTNGR